MNHIRECSWTSALLKEVLVCSRSSLQYSRKWRRPYHKQFSGSIQRTSSTYTVETTTRRGGEPHAVDSRATEHGQWKRVNVPSLQNTSLQPFKSFLFAQNSRRSTPSESKDNDPYGLSSSIKYGTYNDVYRALEASREDLKFVQTIPNTAWHELFRSFDPSKSISHFPRPPPSLINKALRRVARSSAGKAQRLQVLLSNIMGLRRELGVKPDARIYTMILHWAAKLAHNQVSAAIWVDMTEDGIQPNLDCFNARMEAMVGEASAIYKNRPVRPQRGKKPEVLPNLSLEIEELHRRMLTEHGITPDETSYCALLTAYCCEGNVRAAANLLSQIWDVELDSMVDTQQMQGSNYTEKFPPGHPMRPSEKLLFTIADNFGSCNRAVAALRVIQFLSEQYQIHVDPRIKLTLMHWSYYWARKLGREWKREYYGIPELYSHLPDLFKNLQYESMHGIDEKVIHLLLRNTRGLRQAGSEEFKRYLQLGEAMLARNVNSKRRRNAIVRRIRRNPHGFIEKSKSVVRARRLLKHQEETTAVTRAYMRLWLAETLQTVPPDSFPLTPERAAEITEWQVRGIPDIIQRYSQICPFTLKYLVPGGMVCLVVWPIEDTSLQNFRREQANSRPRFIWRRATRKSRGRRRNPLHLTWPNGSLGSISPTRRTEISQCVVGR